LIPLRRRELSRLWIVVLPVLDDTIPITGYPPRKIIEVHRRNIDMGKKLYPSNVLKEAIGVQVAWKHIDEEVALGGMNIAALATDIEEIRKTQPELVYLEHQLMQVRNRRDELYLAAWDKIKRVRASVKGLYGDDSSEYELVGGTRRSDRKRARRTPAAE
jgi:hypothetical protein